MSIFEYVKRMDRAEALAIAKSYAEGFRRGQSIKEESPLGHALGAAGIPPILWSSQAQGLMSEIAVKFLLADDLLALAKKWIAESEGSPSESVLLYCANRLEAEVTGIPVENL